MKVVQISCGCEYTVCLTEEFELMVTGALPFNVSGENCLFRFE